MMVCAGETSGDIHAASLVRRLRGLLGPDTEFFGVGGDLMRAEGVALRAHVSQTGVIGFVEVARRFRFFARLLRDLRRDLAEKRPDLLVTVDYPGLNLRLARSARAAGVPAVHWVCPQVWAWRKDRIPKIAASLDELLCFFPFEPALFEGTGLCTTFTGHPLVEQIDEALAAPAPPLPWGEGTRVALLVGSRPGEVRRILPDVVAGAAMAEKAIGRCTFLL
ncbi:MAG: lipid-A-disaccharide synthase, partial [Kiritimatiellae bacterium]|nr:lipid-A-disaccharide synthase [Kiritimatiellia bacterium]